MTPEEQQRLNELIQKELELINQRVASREKEIEIEKQIKDAVKNGSKGVREWLNTSKEAFKARKELIKAEIKLNAKLAEINKEMANADDERKKALMKIKADLEEELQIEKRKQNQLAKQLLMRGAIVASIASAAALLKAETSYYFQQDKALRSTAQSMGIVGKRSQAFANTMFKTSVYSAELGVDAAELAKMQGKYSDDVGRAVTLTQQGALAAAEMSAGLGIGSEGAAELAANMERFGYSMESTRDYMEDAVKMSTKQGVHTGKVVSMIQANLKKAIGYRFRNGVKDLTDMAVQAAKMKWNMDNTFAITDKINDGGIEGAVELGAKLQVLGGEWAKLGDPFKLMFQARNDPKALQDSLIKAAGATAKFNKETKQFDISALELDRLRQVAKELGVDYKDLAESAQEAAKRTQIKAQIRGGFDKEQMEYLATIAQFGKDGKAYVEIDGKPQLLSALDGSQQKIIQNMMKDNETLKERAKEAQTLDEMWKNMWNTLKAALLPFMKALDKSLRPVLEKAIGWLQTNSTQLQAWFDDFGKRLGNALSGMKDIFSDPNKGLGGILGDFMKKIPGILWGVFKELPFSLQAAIVGLGVMDIAKWVLNGLALAKGFNMGTGGMGGGGGGIGDMLGMGGKTRGIGAGSYMKGAMKSFGQGKFLKGGGRMMKGLGKAAGPLAFLSAGVDLFSNLTDDNLSLGDSLLKTLDQNKGMAAGAAIGSIIPGVGTLIGAGIGGLADMIMPEIGDWGPKQRANASNSITMNDGVVTPKGDVIHTSPKDYIFATQTPGDLVSGGGNPTHIRFDPLTINGRIELTGNGVNGAVDLKNDPFMAKEIARVVQEEIRKAIGGGKLSPTAI